MTEETKCPDFHSHNSVRRGGCVPGRILQLLQGLVVDGVHAVKIIYHLVIETWVDMWKVRESYDMEGKTNVLIIIRNIKKA